MSSEPVGSNWVAPGSAHSFLPFAQNGCRGGHDCHNQVMSTLTQTSARPTRAWQWPLFKFAKITYSPDAKAEEGVPQVPAFQTRLQELANIAEPEDWSYRSTATEHALPILHSYVHHTFMQLEAQGKISISGDNAAFNTGLVSPHQQDIYALFGRNTRNDKGPEWFLLRFCQESDRDMNRFNPLPDIASYYESPDDLVFDLRLELRESADHILGDNIDRFPKDLADQGAHFLRNTYVGAIRGAKERARRNYKTAIPQFYQGSMQLLLPLCLRTPEKADLAIAIGKEGGVYVARTCLTLDMAYNNARLIARPDREWLQP